MKSGQVSRRWRAAVVARRRSRPGRGGVGASPVGQGRDGCDQAFPVGEQLCEVAAELGGRRVGAEVGAAGAAVPEQQVAAGGHVARLGADPEWRRDLASTLAASVFVRAVAPGRTRCPRA